MRRLITGLLAMGLLMGGINLLKAESSSSEEQSVTGILLKAEYYKGDNLEKEVPSDQADRAKIMLRVRGKIHKVWVYGPGVEGTDKNDDTLKRLRLKMKKGDEVNCDFTVTPDKNVSKKLKKTAGC